jgi:hypothetical protein
MAPQRTRFATVLVKAESTPGTDSTPTGGSNAILIENPRISIKPDQITTNEATGSLDGFGDLVGGMQVGISFDCWLRGSSAAGTPPDFGVLLKACGLSETLTATAVPASAEAGAAGSATTLTLGAGATGTAQLYRGMPILLAVNPVAGATDFIQNYTSGKVATLFRTYSPVLDNTTTYQVQKNALYAGSSLAVAGYTIWCQYDGTLYKFVGCRGSFSLDLMSGKPGKFSFTMQGIFESKAYGQSAIVATLDTTAKPIFKGGTCLVNTATLLLKSLKLDIANKLSYPDNPTATDAYDPPEIVDRKWTATIDPLENASGTPDILTDLRAGTTRPIHLHFGSTAGNRFGLSLYTARYLTQDPSDDQGFLRNQVRLAIPGADDAALGLCFF